MPTIVEAQPGEPLREHVRCHRPQLEQRLAQSGAILFRGFGIDEPAALADVVAAARGETMRYLGGDSPRTRIGGDVYTSTECPPSITIPLHNEMSFLETYPRRLWFACSTAPRVGGQTTIADGRAILRDLDPTVRARFAAHGVHYVYSLRGRSLFFDLLDRVQKVTRTWMETFETEDPRVADERAAGLTTRRRWLASGRVVLDLHGPSTIVHPETGERAWFNQAHLFRFSARALGRFNYLAARALFFRRETRSHDARLGDGSELGQTTIDHIFDVLDRHTVAVSWERGDVLWIDNLVCMHGRLSFRGPRRVMVTMTR
jgi:alpha-ketoglutarate-dependent taurine dioxygenase